LSDSLLVPAVRIMNPDQSAIRRRRRPFQGWIQSNLNCCLYSLYEWEGNARSPYANWFDRLNAQAAKVATALTRPTAGNFSNVKGVGSGVFEYRIDFGPLDIASILVIFLGGGTKKLQPQDISAATANWLDYKRRK